MKCSICGTEVTKTQVKYGDANPVRRDANGKIIARAFHHQCVVDSFENERHAIHQEKDEREAKAAWEAMVKA